MVCRKHLLRVIRNLKELGAEVLEAGGGVELISTSCATPAPALECELSVNALPSHLLLTSPINAVHLHLAPSLLPY